MAVSLLSMNKEEAKVAEGVVEYKRADVETQIAALALDIVKDSTLVTQCAEEIQRLTTIMAAAKTRLDANSYKVGLFTALKEAFDKDYPLSLATEQVQQTKKKRGGDIPQEDR